MSWKFVKIGNFWYFWAILVHFWSILANFWPPYDGNMGYFGEIECILMRSYDINRLYVIIPSYRPKNRPKWYNFRLNSTNLAPPRTHFLLIWAVYWGKYCTFCTILNVFHIYYPLFYLTINISPIFLSNVKEFGTTLKKSKGFWGLVQISRVWVKLGFLRVICIFLSVV